MKTNSSFEVLIADWRKEMAEVGIKSPALDELEIHLREEISQQIATGKELAEAFEMASRLIGQANTLGGEFGKNQTRGSAHLIRHLVLATGLGATLGFWLFNSVIMPAMVRSSQSYYRALGYVNAVWEPTHWISFIYKGTLGFMGVAILAFAAVVLIRHHRLTHTMLAKSRHYVFLANLFLGTWILRHSIYDRLFMLVLLQSIFELIVLFAAWKERRERKLAH